MSEVFSVLEVLGRGRYVPHASTNELQAQPRRYEQNASKNEAQEQPGQDEKPAGMNESLEQPLVMTVNANDFSALEEGFVRMVEMVKRERQSRTAAEERASHAEAALNENAQRIDALERELQALNNDRDHAHLRVERLLGQVDALEMSRSAEPCRRPVTSILDRPAAGEEARDQSSVALG